MNKKAQGLSVSMIILIVLGLIIVGVLVYMLGGRVSQFGKSTGSCTEKKGECLETKDCQGAIIGALDCPEKKPKLENPVCCVLFDENPAGGEE